MHENAVKSPKPMALFTFSKAVQSELETLVGWFWPLGLRKVFGFSHIVKFSVWTFLKSFGLHTLNPCLSPGVSAGDLKSSYIRMGLWKTLLELIQGKQWTLFFCLISEPYSTIMWPWPLSFMLSQFCSTAANTYQHTKRISPFLCFYYIFMKCQIIIL